MAKKDKAKVFVFTSPTAMGGIHGGEGFSYQDRYITCHISKWLNEQTFQRLISEGSGDVDVVYHINGIDYYEHIQIKDHNLTNTDFKEAIKTFDTINSGTGKVYRKFILSCTGYNSDVNALINKIDRLRKMREFFDEANKSALQTTEDEVKNAITKLKLDSLYSFILEKVYFETSPLNFSDDSACESFFRGNLISHSAYKKVMAEVINAVYNKVLRKVISHKGKSITSQDIVNEINSITGVVVNETENVVMHLHNWTSERYEPNATEKLDWSKHFDRDTRLVPDEIKWNSELIPELRSLKKKLLSETTSRHIVFRGKCCLSTGLALGMIFPETGGWSFEIVQPGQAEPWKSNVEKKADYSIKHELLNPADFGLGISDAESAVIFNLTGKAQDQVIPFLKASGISLKQILVIQPADSPGTVSIKNNEEAIQLVNSSKDIIKSKLADSSISKTHLFYFGPFSVSVFLGQKLTSVGSIQLYEFQDPQYKPSCLIKT